MLPWGFSLADVIAALAGALGAFDAQRVELSLDVARWISLKPSKEPMRARLPTPKNFFAKTSQRLPLYAAKPFLDRFLSEGA